MKLTREILNDLLSWKAQSHRKPLLLRGARQVGKTFIVREFGRTFTHFIEINLLDNKNLHALFQREHFDVAQIVSEISAYFSVPCIDGETLLFIDEVQACSAAIEALRFFYEKRPGLHIVAAGSLLEFALAEIPSFGVGRIESLFMHPLSFREFMLAQDRASLIERIQKSTFADPMPEVLHRSALEEFRKFLFVGGMPEAVSRYLDQGQLLEVSRVAENIILGYEDDFRKYAGRVPPERLRETLRSSALQAGKKFVYKHAYLDANSQAVHTALNLLNMAGIVHKVHHSASNGIPLGAESDMRHFKTLPLDVALYLRLAGLRLQDLALVGPDEMVNKGALVESMVGLELIAYRSARLRPELFYWHREAKSSNAEVDYVIEHERGILPIEVKASSKGAMTSLRIYLAEKKTPRGVRVSTENFTAYEKILTVPVYAVAEITRVAAEVGR